MCRWWWNSVEAFGGGNRAENQLSKSWTPMAFANSSMIVHLWAEVSSPYTFLSILHHLFSSIEAKNTRISRLRFKKVNFRNLQFLKSIHGLDRSLNVDHFDVWTMRFHPLCIQIFGIEIYASMLFLIESSCVIISGPNQCHICDLRWETERMVYGLCIFVKKCSWRILEARTRLKVKNTWNSGRRRRFDPVFCISIWIVCFPRTGANPRTPPHYLNDAFWPWHWIITNLPLQTN